MGFSMDFPVGLPKDFLWLVGQKGAIENWHQNYMGWAFFSDSNIGLFGLGASWEANTVSGSNLYNKKAMEGHELKQTAGWEKTPSFVACSVACMHLQAASWCGYQNSQNGDASAWDFNHGGISARWYQLSLSSADCLGKSSKYQVAEGNSCGKPNR